MTADIKKDIEKYFIANWTATKIQFEGVNTNITDDEYIGLVYNPVLNERYAFDGTNSGRVRQLGIQKVFCYAKNTTKAYTLADTVKTFLNGAEFNGLDFEIGQDRMVVDLENGFFEVLVETQVNKFL